MLTIRHKYPLLLLFVITFSVSCSKKAEDVAVKPNSIALPDIKNGRLSFASSADFSQYLRKLSQEKQEDLEKLTTDSKFVSLYKTLNAYAGKDETLTPELEALNTLDLPNFLSTVLNQHGEVQIGDSISWFSNNKQFFIHQKDAGRLEDLKRNPGIDTRSLPAYAEKISHSRQVHIELSGISDAGNIGDGKWQHEFVAQYPNSGNRKYVVEMVGFIVSNDRYLRMRIKLEWKGSGSWKPAGESRSISVAITSYANFISNNLTGVYLVGPNQSFNFSSTTSSILELPIAAFDVTGGINYSSYWALTLYGTITMQIVGDVPANIWTLSGDSSNPLW
jgi:hypothetical protein